MTAKEYNETVGLWADDVMRFARRCCADRAECEDAVQEAFASLWRHREGVEAGKGKGYLMGAAYRHLQGRYRHRAVERKHAGQLVEERTAQPDVRFDVREAIDRALQSLPEVQRAIMQLRDVEGYAYAEIAATLGISEDRVQVYLFRARVAMRKRLVAMGYDEHNR